MRMFRAIGNMASRSLPINHYAVFFVSVASCCHGFSTFALYKPDGYLSQFVNNGQIKKRQKMLGELDQLQDNLPDGIMAVGRLDEMSEGLLLLTTDGSLSYLINKGGNVEKEYYAQVDGVITGDAIEKLQQGVDITVRGKPFSSAPCPVVRVDEEPSFSDRLRNIRNERHGPTSWVSITLREGKKRQVRKMTSAVGFPTLRLVRVRVGDMRLGSMKPGELRKLCDSEVSKIREAAAT